MRSTKLTSYCDVNNPTRHMEPMLESCKVGEYSYRMYDDLVIEEVEGKKKKKIRGKS